MLRVNNKQKGMTGIGIGFLMILMGMIIVVALKLIPIYIENFTVSSALDSLKNSEKVLDSGGIKSRLLKNFDLNNISTVRRHHIKVTKLGHNNKEVTIEYEVRRPVMGNVDVVVHFINSVEITGKGD